MLDITVEDLSDPKSIRFADLRTNQPFRYAGHIYVKRDQQSSRACRLVDGDSRPFDAHMLVEPVRINLQILPVP